VSDGTEAWTRHEPPFWLRPRTILIALAVLLVVGPLLLSRMKGSYPPDPDCAKVTVAKAGDAPVPAGSEVFWTITGPDARYGVTIGAEQVTVAGGTLGIAMAERGAEVGAVVAYQPTPTTGCRTIGRTQLHLPRGTYTLKVWRLDGDTATQVAATTVESAG